MVATSVLSRDGFAAIVMLQDATVGKPGGERLRDKDRDHFRMSDGHVLVVVPRW